MLQKGIGVKSAAAPGAKSGALPAAETGPDGRGVTAGSDEPTHASSPF